MFDFESTPVRKARIEIIPMIDVMMFLLVFFVLISLNVIPAQGLQTQLPKSSQASSIDPEKPMIVSISSAGQIEFEGKSITLGGLTEKLQERLNSTEVNVIIKSDKKTEMQQMVNLMDAIKLAGVTKVSISTVK